MLGAVLAAAPGWASARQASVCPPDSVRQSVSEAIDNGRFDEASERLDPFLDRGCEDPDVLALRLRLMRSDPGMLPPPIRALRRRNLAQRILELDSLNAVAHVELGRGEEEAYFDWAHAVTPALTETELGIFQGTAQVSSRFSRTATRETEFLARDRFDIERLEDRGYTFRDNAEPARKARGEALAHFRAALRGDPGSRDAALSLLRLYAAEQDWVGIVNVARSIGRDQPDNPLPLMATGLAFYHAGDVVRAEAAFSSSAASDPSVADAFADLSVLLSPSETEDYEARSDGYENRYWNQQDPRLLTPVNERQVEHRARIVYADLVYSAPHLGLRGWETDRGRLYVRYGAPEEITVFTFRFYAGRAQGGRTEVWQYPDFRFVFEDVMGHDEYRLFTPPADALGATRFDLSAQDFVAAAESRIRDEPVRSQYVHTRRIQFPQLVSVFRGVESAADVFVVFGVPVAPPPGDGPVASDLQTGVFLTDSRGERVAEVRSNPDRIPRSRIQALPQATIYLDIARLQAPTGTFDLATEFEASNGRVAGWTRDSLRIAEPTGGALQLSDLMLAYLVEEEVETETDVAADEAAGLIRRRGFRIAPAPWFVFSRDQLLYLYFEAYGLQLDPAGQAAFGVEVLLVPAEERGNLRRLWDRLRGGNPTPGVSVSFQATGSGAEQGHYATLDLANQPRGEYVIALRISQGDQIVEAERRLILE